MPLRSADTAAPARRLHADREPVSGFTTLHADTIPIGKVN